MELKKEKRCYNSSEIKLRALEENGKKYIEAYASIYNHRSKLLFDNVNGRNQLFYETILPGAFDNVLNDSNLNVILNYNHDRNQLLGRFTRSNNEEIANSIELNSDEYGLKYRTELPNTTLANDVFTLLSRGDLFEGSFSFDIEEGKDTRVFRNEKNELIREIKNISGLYDVSIVTDGAYSDTDILIKKRDIVDFFIQEEKIEEQIIPEIDNTAEKSEVLKRKLRLLKLK